jgi:hypothetical protein
MSTRLQIVIPDPVAAQLQELASAAGEPLATLASRIVRDGVAVAGAGGKRQLPRESAPTAGETAQRPQWLEPYGGDPVWWREMWGSIVALHGRYPRHLEHLQEGWWEDEAQAEILCALVVWRAEIDEHGRDPREELAFHQQLTDVQRTLRQGGGVESAWAPGAPHERWDGSLW